MSCPLLVWLCPSTLFVLGNVPTRGRGEERRGWGWAQRVKQQRGEERRERGRKGADGEVGRTPKGRGLPLFFIPPSVQSNSLIYCRSPNWRCEGGCWTGDAERTDAASRRWRAQWGRRRARRFPSQLSRQRDSTKTHPPPSPSSSLLSSSKSTSSAADAAASLPPSPQSHSEQLCWGGRWHCRPGGRPPRAFFGLCQTWMSVLRLEEVLLLKKTQNSRGWRRAGCCRVKEGKLQVPLSSCSARREPKCWNFDEESEKTGL